jgi:capsular polysaccharide biosynthesis protein
VAIVANATHVAGPSGSALHLMLFNASPQARLIELRTKRAYNQLLISAIRGNEAFHVSCETKKGATGHTNLDMDVVERALREID